MEFTQNARKDTRFKKGNKAWNKGMKVGLVYPGQVENLKKGNPARWAKHKGEPAWNAQKVKVYDLNGVFIKNFLSTRLAAKELHVNQRNIRNVLAGNRGRVGNYQFKKATTINYYDTGPVEPYEGPVRHNRVDQDDVNIDGISATLIPYRESNRCAKCIFSQREKGVCKKLHCCENERRDRRSGFFRKTNEQNIECHYDDTRSMSYNQNL